MQDRIRSILDEMKAALENAKSNEAMQEIRVKYLGKKGEITSMMKQMGSLSPEERPSFGQRINAARKEAEEALEARQRLIANKLKNDRLKRETIDVTLPGKTRFVASEHPLTKVCSEIKEIFTKMGYTVLDGPEIELDRFNFELLNIPKDHPSRDMQDTFYISDEIVLRTQTSPVQARTMLTHKPPIRMICPGRVYRTDDVDATHSPVFNQIEGLYIDKGVTFADLKATINTFLSELYGEGTKTKFRPSFFPFTEPSAEVDATCSICKGKGCPACKGEGVIEVLGCGMVNPKVLENCGIDPEVYSGFAFGLGLDRITNIKYGITDIRHLYENDIRFLDQFK